MKTIGLLFSSVVFLGLGVLTGFYMDFSKWADRLVSAEPGEKVFSVPPGQKFRAISDELEQAGLLDDPFKFRLLARLNEDDKKIKAGEYMVPLAVSPKQLLNILKKGRVRLHRLTVPEGLNLQQVADLVEKNGFGSAKDFYALTVDRKLLAENQVPADTFEGYLFPETYLFPRGAQLRVILQTMVDRFRTVFTAKWSARSRELGFSVHEIVTLASIIEKETGTGFERPLISSVFHNRLKRGMRLETDPTVIYGIKDFNGNITRKDLETPTPYNTYMIKGLPPGPIANPGLEALKAALYPAETKFLYFVSKQDSTHQFSTNYKAHSQAVKQYQLRKN